ncbi:MAG TPA: MarC family protein [Burkholderiales bacterium]|jgi:multiple antibiotic resistance protein
MSAFANTFLLVYAALFPIINPVGGAPLFLGLTQFATEAQRAQLARRVAVNCFFLLLGSLVVGSHVLEFFGISLAVVRIAGGLVVSAFGWRLLNSETHIDGGAEEGGNATIPDSFYPLTMPLTVGPGSMSVAITLGSQRPRFAGLTELLLLGGAAVAGLAAMALTIYVCYRSAERTVRVLGKTGTGVVVRLSAFILLCIGIQILWGGLADLLVLKKP